MPNGQAYDAAATFDTPVGGNERAIFSLGVTQRQFTRELRLQSNPDTDSKLNYVFGLFYQNLRQPSTDRDYMPGGGRVGDGAFRISPFLALPNPVESLSSSTSKAATGDMLPSGSLITNWPMG